MSSENMSEEECSPPKCPRQDDSSSEKELRSAAECEEARSVEENYWVAACRKRVAMLLAESERIDAGINGLVSLLRTLQHSLPRKHCQTDARCLAESERLQSAAEYEEAKASARSYAEQINNQLQCNGRYSPNITVKVAILADGWGHWSWQGSNVYLTTELSKQLAKFPYMKVSMLVPEGSCSELEKKTAEIFNVTIVEAKKQPGFKDPSDWLYFLPKGLTTDIVVGIGDKLCKMAQIFKVLHHCKSIFFGSNSFEESLSRETKLRSVLAEMEDVCQCDVQPIVQMADLPVGLGPKIAGRLSDSLTCQGKEVFELTPGILTEFADITQTPRDREKFRILVAGHGYLRYFYKERLEIVAKAVAKLKDESYEIIFVGAAEGEHRGFMKKFRKCGVPKHQMIIRSPPKDEEEMKSWLCEADLAIVPSDEQEFGMFGLAALSSGLPILVHGASGLGEALRYVDGGRLSIVKSEDISEWSKAIKTVRNLERTVRLDEADLLRKHYNEKYSWEKQCGDLVEEMLKMASAQQDKTQ